MSRHGVDGDLTQDLLTVLVAVLLLTMVVGHLLGQPAVLGYVETESMSPALEAGDGFVAIPGFLASGTSVGDVVVYDAEAIEGGGLTTHRVVGETEHGFVTRGDANPFTDQDSGEPYVTDERVKAKALQVGGNVVAIPRLGTAVSAVQSAVGGILAFAAGTLGLGSLHGSQLGGFALIAFGVVLFASSQFGSRRHRSRERKVSGRAVDGRKVAAVILVAVLAPATLAMIAPSGHHSFDSSAEGASFDVEPGETVEHEVTATNHGLVSMLVVIEPRTASVEVEPRSMALTTGETRSTTVSVTVQDDGSTPTASVSEHRYFVLIPPNVIEKLHGVHPGFALLAVNAVIGFGVLGLVGGLFGFGKLRFRDTSRKTPVVTRVRRMLR